MAVIDIRGTHGSGKSYIVHQLLGAFPGTPILDDDEQIIGYYLEDIETAVVGKYTTDCGGCDGIKTADEVVRRVKLFHGSEGVKNVVLEGILVSHTFARYSALAKGLEDYRFLFLDTPMEVCIARVQSRRLARANRKPFNPRNLVKDWHCIWGKVRVKCQEAGHKVVVVSWQNPVDVVLEQM